LVLDASGSRELVCEINLMPIVCRSLVADDWYARKL